MEYTKISKKMKSPVDGLELDLLILVPEEAPKGILQIHHGMAEYKERYLPFMKYFAEAGYVAAIHDCRGHGKSVRTKKDLGYMYGAGMDALIEDTAEVTRMLKEEWQGVPLILLGHSMGSMVVRCFTKKYDDLLNMLVVCGSPSKNPGAKIGIALAAVQEKISGAHHVSRFLELLSLGSYSGKFAGEGSRFAWCCSDEQVVRAYEASELCGFTFTVDADQVLFQLMDETYRETGWKLFNPDLPVLFIGGLIRQTNGEFEEKFAARGLQMVCKMDEEPLVIMADGRRMWRVVENLYNNIAKYAMPNTRVYAEARRVGCRVVLEIKNISENPLNIKAEELTERFIRGDVSRSTEGSGLGLSIAKNLVGLQGGTFDIYLDGDLFKVVITFEAVDKES